ERPNKRLAKVGLKSWHHCFLLCLNIWAAFRKYFHIVTGVWQSLNFDEEYLFSV
uniref:Uncharacterized protein n=1 Tax=Cyprinus carpio TaxID=7962 RepID=A0A8C2HPQ3_CYPCA